MSTIIKTLAILFTATLFAASCGDQQDKSAKLTASSAEVNLTEFKQQISYIFGANIGEQFKRDNIDLDPDAFVMALIDVQENRALRLTPEELQAAMTQFQQAQQQREEETSNVIAEANKKEGKVYMQENAKKEGVVTTASGLQYKQLVVGNGPKPTATDTVTVNYRGTLLDGTVFDSSYDRGKPVSFPISGVIPGWTEALQLMPVGSKWELIIPSDLAYGPGGVSREIGPNATLKFEVELLKIN
jgi:FKBP-type peptidyl-prolyl cis-trans isomerase FklB